MANPRAFKLIASSCSLCVLCACSEDASTDGDNPEQLSPATTAPATGMETVSPSDTRPPAGETDGKAAMGRGGASGGMQGEVPQGGATVGGAGGTSNPGTNLPAEASEGCSAAEPLPDGDALLSFDGKERAYKVYLPSMYGETEQAWPLVFALHPNNQKNGLNFWDSRGIGASADGRAIVIAAESVTHDGSQVWNRAEDEAEHLAYFDALLAKAKASLCIDTRRVFAMGHSGGASFSSVLGCLREDYRGIASNGGALYFELKDMDPADCVGTPAAWVNYGTEEDGTLTRDFWRERNECDLDEADDPDFNADPPCVAYETCEAGSVTHCSHEGGHLVPDFAADSVLDFFVSLEP